MFQGRNRKNPYMQPTTDESITSSGEDYFQGETPILINFLMRTRQQTDNCLFKNDASPPEDEKDTPSLA